MTNRQSNIIFYSIIFLVLTAATINIYNPSLFDVFTSNKEERLIKEAVSNGEYDKALNQYHILINSDDDETIHKANLFEEMANLYLLLGKNREQKEYYLKSLKIKLKIKKIDIFSLSKTYYFLGAILEEEKEYDQAQDYYEKALLTRLGNTKKLDKDDDGLFVSMQQSRLLYLRENNEGTVLTYSKLGNVHYLKEEYLISKDYYEKALAASKLTFKEDDNDTFDVINNKLTQIENKLNSQ